MKLYESYVAEAKARRRRRMAGGLAGAGLLASLAIWALVSAGVFSGAARVPSLGVDAGIESADQVRPPARQ